MLPPRQADKEVRSSHGEGLLMGKLGGRETGICSSPGELAV